MTIWGAMLIPVVAVFVLLLFFQHRTKWWEVAIPLVASAIMIGGFKWMAEHMGTKDMEVWNGWTVSAHYYEPWNEYIHRTCTRTVSCGKNCTTTQVYDCSYVQNHSEYWAIKDSNDAKHRITKQSYQHFISLFGMSPQFVDMRRNYHSRDGDMYQVLWPKTDETVEPVNTAHHYENRVQASRSVFNYVKLTEREITDHGIFEYPEVTLFDYPSILGDCGPTTKAGNERLRFHNSKLGRSKQLRMWILCTGSGDPAWGQLQESHWVGGNKNEAVLVVGKNWSHFFTWSDSKAPLIEARDYVQSHREDLDMVQVADLMAAGLDQSFVRKQFAEFSYLTVEPPTWAVVMTYLVTLMINVGLGYFVVHNDFHEGSNSAKLFSRRRRYRY